MNWQEPMKREAVAIVFHDRVFDRLIAVVYADS